MFRFENQQLLYWLLLVVFFIATYIFLFVRDKRRMERYCERGLLGKLTAQTSHGMQHLKFAVLMLALVCFIFAAANPQTAGKMEKVKRKGVDIMLCLDVSNSMLATDIQPNRLDACKMAINRFIDKLTGDRVGLVVFAGKSFVQLPITTDYAAAKMFINQISTQMMPTQGTDISAALATAAAAMTPELDEADDNADSKPSRVILVASDGEDHFPEGAMTAAELAKEGFVIHTIGIGSTKGVPIPIGAGGKQFKKDNAGNTVITRLNETTLKDIASAGGGAYVHATNANMGFETILNEINAMEKSDIEDVNFTMYESYYQYPLLVGILLLFIESLLFTTTPKIKELLAKTRRHYKTAVLLLAVGCLFASCKKDHTRPSALNAGNVEFAAGDSLRAHSLFEPDSIMPFDTTGESHYTKALEIYDSTAANELVNANQTLFDQIDAHYRLNRFDTIPRMADSLRRMCGDQNPEFLANVFYNEGNSYMQQKQYGQAIQAYKEALKRNPKDMDAKYNLVYAKKMAETHGDGGGGGQNQQQQQDQQKQDQQGQGKNDQQKDQQQQQQQGQGQQDKQQQQQGQQGQQQQQARQKDAMMRQLDALQQNERQTQKKVNVQRVPEDQRSRQNQEKDW